VLVVLVLGGTLDKLDAEEEKAEVLDIVPEIEVGDGNFAVLVDVTVTPGQPAGKFEVPPLAYRLNCLAPPHLAVPVLLAPILPLHTSVHAFAPVRLEIADPWKLKVLPP